MAGIIRSFQILADLTIASLAFGLAYLLRFEFSIPDGVARGFLLNLPWVVGLQYLGLFAFGVTRLSWRYLNMRDAVRVFFALSSPTGVVLALRLTHALPVPSEVVIPLSVIAMDFVLVFVGLVGVRAGRRLWAEHQDRRRRNTNGERHRVLLIGAGEAGVIVARELLHRPDLALQPVGFLDDDGHKRRALIGGIPVLGTTAEIAEIARQKRVTRALITIANASGPQIRRITELCRDAGLETKIIPGIYEIVGDKVNLSRVREVAIEDLLGREPVQLDEQIVGDSIRSRTVLVTGGGGSIGSELCRQICRFGPARLIVLERFENALFQIHRELTSAFPHVPVEPRIADVCDVERLAQIFDSTKPEIVFHAAAHKHVPMMEWNPCEAVKNNVGGTRNVADIADRFGVERFVLVSTDKAVNPTSIMGATKRIAEVYLQALSRRSATRFVAVRFGNVLGSNGSVIPLFREQIARGGPVTVTHPEMRRYFMTIPEASQLVLQAGAMGQGGEIFILDMGEPVKIVDLANDVITLSGLRPGEDIEIVFSGVRPGEKLFEELSTSSEQAEKTTHPKVFTGRIRPHEWDHVSEAVDELLDRARRGESDRMRAGIRDLVPEYARAATSVRDTGVRSEHTGETPAVPVDTVGMRN